MGDRCGPGRRTFVNLGSSVISAGGTDLRFGFQDIENRARLHHIALSGQLLDDHARTW